MPDRRENIIGSASLCPIRTTGDGIEVLLTRRAFWNAPRGRPMTYPGEWVFAGGAREAGDGCLAETAVREFREELGYDGPVTAVRLLRSGTVESAGRTYHVEFHAARLDPACDFGIREGGEVIEARWFAPADALALIRSEGFARELLAEHRARGLADERFGAHAVRERRLPEQTILTLELIASTPGLRDEYA